LRAGTENVPGIVGFGKACELAGRWLNRKEPQRIAALVDRLETGIRNLVPGAERNGGIPCLPNTLNMTLPGIRGESLVLHLDPRGIYFSSGSACKSGNPDPSHVLLAIGLSEDDAHCAIRLSLGVGNSEKDIDYTLDALSRVLRESQHSVQFAACR
jgi:cysteine sulfinate desulfinase/cysteine desulfurase-like protein